MALLNRVLDFFTSLRLTVACLFFAMVLVFVGTLAQVDIGLYNAQNKFFRSVLVFWGHIPVLPGGYFVGAVLLVNLLAAHIKRFQLSMKHVGIYLIHSGLILLLVGQFLTDRLSRESYMRLTEGESQNYSESAGTIELAITDTSDPKFNEVVSIPESALAHQKEIRHHALPFAIRVEKYWRNSRLTDHAANTAVQGLGRTLEVIEVAPTTKDDERNLPSAFIELIGNNGSPRATSGSLGRWLVSLNLAKPQIVSCKGKTYNIALRSTRFYKSFSFQLLKFTHEKYPGTDIPKKFMSHIHITDPLANEDRDVLIYMNNPLRYRGETFYQGSFDPNDPRVSILQVVRNPSWLTPYFAVALVALGLAIQFLSHLIPFARRSALQGATATKPADDGRLPQRAPTKKTWTREDK